MSLRTNLVSWWKLEESSGARVDSHGSNDLTDNNTVLSGTGKQGTCADFEATNSEFLSITDGTQSGLNPTGDMSWACWINLESLPSSGNYYEIVTKWLATGNQRSYAFAVYNNAGTYQLNWAMSLNGSTTPNQGSYNYTFSTATWYHVAFTYNSTSGTGKFYVNGNEIGSTTGTAGAPYDNTADFILGQLASGSYFDGVIDEFGFWADELTVGEVRALYNNGDGITYEDTDTPTDIFSSTLLSNDLISYWALDEASGTRSDSHGSNTLTDNNTVGSTSGILSSAGAFVASNNEYLSHADDASLDVGTGDFSFSFWFKLSTTTIASTENVIRKWSPGYVVQFKSTDREIHFFTNDGTSATVISNTNAIPNETTTWHHCVVTRSGTTGVIYVDGVDVTSSGTTRSGNLDGTGIFYIGSNGTSEAYNHYLDEVGFWKKVLSSSEVSDLYNSGVGLAYQAYIAYTLNAVVGAFTLTGVSATLAVARYLLTTVGSFILSGVDISFQIVRPWTQRTKNTATASAKSKNPATFTVRPHNEATWTPRIKR